MYEAHEHRRSGFVCLIIADPLHKIKGAIYMTNEELVIRIKVGEVDLMPILWEQTKRFAYKQANAFYHRHADLCSFMGLEQDDLIQEAYFGIHKAVKMYDAEKGVKFLTYVAGQQHLLFTEVRLW
jgi:DNA-directed RNA polymerase specialized sigma subunit